MEHRAGLFPKFAGDCDKRGSVRKEFYVDPTNPPFSNNRGPRRESTEREIEKRARIVLQNEREREKREATLDHGKQLNTVADARRRAALTIEGQHVKRPLYDGTTNRVPTERTNKSHPTLDVGGTVVSGAPPSFRSKAELKHSNTESVKSLSILTTASTAADLKVFSAGGGKFVYADVDNERYAELKKRFEDVSKKNEISSGGSARNARYAMLNGCQIPFETYIVDNTDLADPNLQGLAIPVLRSCSNTEYPTLRWGESVQGVGLGVDWFAVRAGQRIGFVPRSVAGHQVVFPQCSEYGGTLFKLTADGQTWHEKWCMLKSGIMELTSLSGQRSGVKLRHGYWLCPLSEFVGIEGMRDVENIVHKRPFSFALGTTLSKKDLMKIFVFDAQSDGDLRTWLSCISQAIPPGDFVTRSGGSCGLVNGRLVASSLSQSGKEAISEYFRTQAGEEQFFNSQGMFGLCHSLSEVGFRRTREHAETEKEGYEGDFIVVDKKGASAFASPAQTSEQRDHILPYGSCVMVGNTEEVDGNRWLKVGDLGWVRERLTGQVLSQINYVDVDSKFSSPRARAKNLGQTFEMYSSPCLIEPLPTTVMPGQSLEVMSIGWVKYPDDANPIKDVHRFFYFVADDDGNLGWLPALSSNGIDILENVTPEH